MNEFTLDGHFIMQVLGRNTISIFLYFKVFSYHVNRRTIYNGLIFGLQFILICVCWTKNCR